MPSARSVPFGAALAALLVPALAAAQAARPVEPPHHLVQVVVRDAHTIRHLLDLDLDLAACTALELPARLVDVIATDGDIERMTAAGLTFEVAIRNLEDHHARELARFGQAPTQTLTPPLGQGGMGGHYTLAQIVAILDSFATDHPAICAPKVSIGTSHEGRDIWMVKISDNVGIDEGEPEVLYDGVHHAREMLSVEAMLLFMDELLTGYANNDPEARFIVDERELYFVPVLNPDGHEYNRQTNPGGGGMWRKNRRNNGGGVYGVDLNRNWTTGWNAPNGGNSTNPGSDTYRGPAPLSEPEVAALEAFIGTRQLVQGFSCHTYQDVLLRPWGYQVGDPPNVAEYDAIGDVATSQNGIVHGPASTTLYIAAGTALDHYHAAWGMYGWTPEMGRSNEGGFWPNPVNTVAIARRHQHMFRTIALTSGPRLQIGDVAVTEEPGFGNNNGAVEPGEVGRVIATLRNEGAVNLAGPVAVTLTAVSAGLQVLNGSTSVPGIARFSGATTTAGALTFLVPTGYASPVAELTLRAAGGGQDDERPVRVVLGAFRVAVDDDMERDRGFARDPASTASTGLFERAAPAQTISGSTVIQPGADHTPNGTLCWVTDGRGGSAGTYDVDGGWTDLISPRLDLRHLGVARLVYWRFYSESVGDDAFEAFVSNDDGRAWTRLLADSASTNGWVRAEHEIAIALTDQIRVRFRAQDLNASLVEALIDDLAIEAVADDGALTALSSGALGSTLRLSGMGAAGASLVPLVSTGTADLPVPGIGGRLLLDPARVVALPWLPVGAGGSAAIDLAIPTGGGLAGATLHWQLLHVAGANLTFGNRQSVTLR